LGKAALTAVCVLFRRSNGEKVPQAGSEAFTAFGNEFAPGGCASPITLEVGTEKLCMLAIDPGYFNEKFFINF
jgi:hypothetical protein